MPYGLWRSPMKLTELFAEPPLPMYPFRYQGQLHWLETLPQGRTALMRQSRDARQPRGRLCLTPSDFNIRTAVHEYGGRCFCLFGTQIIFNNFSDGQLYRQQLVRDSSPVALTARLSQSQQASSSFADLLPLAQRNAVLAVMETKHSNGEQHNRLVAVKVADEAARGSASVSSTEASVTPITLLEGSDFYACPVVSPDQSELAWLEWDNPYMPWDQSRLVKAELTGCADTLAIRNRQVVVDEIDQAVCQIGFLADNSLLFISDGGASYHHSGDQDNRTTHTTNGFWNFFRAQDHTITQVTDDRCEYGEAHWVFGQRRWQPVSANKIIAVASRNEGDQLVEITLSTKKPSATKTPPAPLVTSIQLPENFAVCADLCTNATEANVEKPELLLVARYAERRAEIRTLELPVDDFSRATTCLAYAPTTQAKARAGSHPQPITYPTTDGQHAYAYFYSPCSCKYRAPAHSKPPLLVVVHGGPTSRASMEMNPLKQFFTSLGYAVLDINHRGSTGYGRAYRQSLLGQWGEIDTLDIADGVRYVVKKGWVNPHLVFIRGGSAGGYAVLCALTRFPQMFSGGACYYGIGNLITLANVTHKFEGHYTDRLLGETFTDDSANNPTSRFVQRSPIFHLQRLDCPLIIFQGQDDKVVPPAVSRELAERLAKKGIPHEYIEYQNEGHGFRILANRIDSISRETAFFATIIRTKTPTPKHQS